MADNLGSSAASSSKHPRIFLPTVRLMTISAKAVPSARPA
jgi:hypothetical protein